MVGVMAARNTFPQPPDGVEPFLTEQEEERLMSQHWFLPLSRLLGKLVPMDELIQAKKKRDIEDAEQARLQGGVDQAEANGDPAELGAAPQPEPEPAAEVQFDEEPEVQHQSFFPCQVPMPSCTFEGEELQEMCRSALSSLQSDAGGAADDVTITRELILGGWLQLHYLGSGSCPESVVRFLWELLAFSPDRKLARGALTAFLALMGDKSGDEATAGGQFGAASTPALYTLPPWRQSCTLAWLPDDRTIMAAIRAHGYSPQRAGQGGRRPRGTTAAALAAAAVNGGGPSSSEPDLALAQRALGSLRLILRALAAVCRYQQRQQSGVAALSAGGLPELLTACLQLRLDPQAQLLTAELDMVLQPLLDAFSEADFERKAGQMGADVAALGPSPASHLAALKLLPAAASARARTVQELGAVALASSQLQSRREGAAGAQRRRGGGSGGGVRAEEAVEALGWYRDGGKALVARAQGRSPAYSLQEVETVLHAAIDLLIVPQIKAQDLDHYAGPSAPFLQRYLDFLQAGAKEVKMDAQNPATSRLKRDLLLMTFRIESELTRISDAAR